MQLSWFVLSMSAAIMWGLQYVLLQRSLETLSAPQALFIIWAIGSVVLGFICYFNGELTGIVDKAKTVPLWAFGGMIFIGITANLAILKSVQMSNAALAAVIEISYPVFTVFFAWLLLGHQAFTWSFILGGSLIMIGSYIIARFGGSVI